MRRWKLEPVEISMIVKLVSVGPARSAGHRRPSIDDKNKRARYVGSPTYVMSGNRCDVFQDDEAGALRRAVRVTKQGSMLGSPQLRCTRAGSKVLAVGER